MLTELLSWEAIDFEQDDAKANHLLRKFDKCMAQKEDENRSYKEQREQWRQTTFKSRKQAQQALEELPAPDPTLPPFDPVKNEPFVDSSFVSKFSDEVVLDKLNDFADSTLKMGESLLKRLSQSEFFSRTSTLTKAPQ